ncbi:ralA-binding protein 1-like isoform X1 [Dreissena polymorpha]|uniref:ralA-binding protein 1-like isoform X1 n=2 Tax=Dreissena polymorpha TaxID=45954 RepID=UPI002264D617|nr:ralA-binding protein 1-like isoform X1 [Dreissena polymorpha]XP_052236245.1 ralA-binding protein 1-like isoform X1 [Dreissena polymorpha]
MSDTEKNFQGLSGKEAGKKKDGKKDKGKGYVMFDANASDEEPVLAEDNKSPFKMKKGKAFRFGSRKDIISKVKGHSAEDKDKDGKKEEKEKRKGEKKHKIKGKKNPKHDVPAVPEVIEKPVFGVPLMVAIDRCKSHDGVQLPALFRECIDYIEEHGLHCEGIYRISGVKSKVQHLKDLYNRGQEVYLEEHEPNIVAGVLKQFLRELPEPVLTHTLIPKFEEASTIRNERRRVEAFLKLIRELPECNRLLLSWMIVHMTHVIERQKENKMTLQNVSIVLSPTMQISHRVLNILFMHTSQLFTDTAIKRYVPPLKPATSRWSLELPDQPGPLEEELNKQESLLAQLHAELASGTASTEKEEQIWEVQRICTQLKRKIKVAKKGAEVMEKRKRDRDETSKRNVVHEEHEETAALELPEGEVLKLELRTPPPDAPQPPMVDEDSQELETETEPLGETENRASRSRSQEKVTLKELANQSRAKSEESMKRSAEITDISRVEQVGVEMTSDGRINVYEEVAVTENAEDEKVEGQRELEDQEVKVEENLEHVSKLEETKDNIKETGKMSQESVSVQTVLESDSGQKVTDVESVAATDDTVQTVTESVKTVDECVQTAADDESRESEERGLSAEAVKSALAMKALLQDDSATDSELGQSREDLPKLGSESDEFEQSLEEILERDLGALEVTSESGDTQDELVDEQCEGVAEAIISTEAGPEERVAMETKTPVPVETPDSPTFTTESPESPPVTTPVPQLMAATEETDLNTSSDVQGESGLELEISEISEDDSYDEEEWEVLLEEEYALKLEEEELLAIESELRKKIETERCEADRLQQEIDELQYLRQDSDEEIISTSSDSSYESEDEEDLQEILEQLIKENEKLECENSEVCTNIHKERMICLDVKVQIGLLQQKHARRTATSDPAREIDSLIEFD